MKEGGVSHEGREERSGGGWADRRREEAVGRGPCDDGVSIVSCCAECWAEPDKYARHEWMRAECSHAKS